MPEELAAEGAGVVGPPLLAGSDQVDGLLDLGVGVVGVVEDERLERLGLPGALPLVASLVGGDEVLDQPEPVVGHVETLDRRRG